MSLVKSKQKTTCWGCGGEGKRVYDCPHCACSGEGMYDGSVCWYCKGKGETQGECHICEGTGEINSQEESYESD